MQKITFGRKFKKKKDYNGKFTKMRKNYQKLQELIGFLNY